MKKLLFAFSALALIFTSCSSDDDSSTPTPTGTVLIKRIVATDEDGTVATTFNYSGTKLVTITDDSGDDLTTYITYTGDNITKIEYKYSDGTVEQTDYYSYNAEGKLISYVRLDPGMDWGNKELYTYNTDGTVSVEHYIGDTAAQTQLNNTGKVFFTNGEVSKIEEYHGATTYTNTYTHDTANGVFKNITGWAKLAFVEGYAESMAHNILTEVSTNEGTTTNVYTYNAANYPVSVVTNDSFGETTAQFFYE